MNILLSILLAFQVALGGSAQISGPSALVGTPPSATVTQLCAANVTSCSGLTVASGVGLVAIVTSENAAPSYSFTDPCSDTWAQSSASPIYYSAPVTTVSLYTTTTSCPIASGTISTSGAAISILAIFSLAPVVGSDSSINASAPMSGLPTAYSAGPTSNTTAPDVCFAGMMASGSNTFSAGAGFILAAGSNQVIDSRQSAFEYGTFASGVPVTFTATLSSGDPGVILGQCVKY